MKFKRYSKGYLLRLVFCLCALSACSLSMFWLPEKNVGERMRHALTLLLASVAFQFVIDRYLPQIPYLTLLDHYVIGNFVFFAVLAMWPPMSSDLKISISDTTAFRMYLCAWLTLHIFVGLEAWYASILGAQKSTAYGEVIEKMDEDAVHSYRRRKSTLRVATEV